MEPSPNGRVVPAQTALLGTTPSWGDITERRVELLIDHRLIAALQTTRECYERRHSWMLAFTDIMPNDLLYSTTDDGFLQITFGTVAEGYEKPWIFYLDAERYPTTSPSSSARHACA